MSEYEMASLFYQVVETAHAAITNFLTVVFAVLLVSYFAIGMINEIVSLYAVMVRLGWQMVVEFDTEGGALSWLGIADSNASGPRWSIPITAGVMCGLAYIGSLFFFSKSENEAIQNRIYDSPGRPVWRVPGFI